MNKIDRIIHIVRELKEEMGMTTGSSGPIAGFSEKSPSQGPTAGISPKLGPIRKRYVTGGTGSRKHWLDYLKRKSN